VGRTQAIGSHWSLFATSPSPSRLLRKHLIVFCYEMHLTLSIWKHCLCGTASFLGPFPPKVFIPDRLVGHFDLESSESDVFGGVARHPRIGLSRG